MMSTKEKLAVVFFIFTLIIAIALRMRSTSDLQVSFENGAKVRVEFVNEPPDLATGLMFRGELGKERGMLFIYAYDDYQRIWMKNMKFPIDIIWIDSDYRIKWVVKDAKPCTVEPCEVYSSPERARFVLEVNSGFAKANNITPGQKVTISQPFF